MRVRRCWLVLLALFAVGLALLVPLVLRPLPRYAKHLTLRERLRMHTWVVLRGFSHWIVRSRTRTRTCTRTPTAHSPPAAPSAASASASSHWALADPLVPLTHSVLFRVVPCRSSSFCRVGQAAGALRILAHQHDPLGGGQSDDVARHRRRLHNGVRDNTNPSICLVVVLPSISRALFIASCDSLQLI